MQIKNEYKPRPIRFLEIYEIDGWQLKIYSISTKNELVGEQLIENSKKNISLWLKNSENYKLETYQIATLILHEGNEGNFAIINWWIDENMLQNHVYFSSFQNPYDFKNYSDKGIQTCVWELAVIWFERNAWVKHVLKKNKNPDFEAYLHEHMNENV